MAEQPEHISKLLHFFMRNRFPKNLEKKVQGWYCNDEHRQEKDEALKRYYEDMPTLESEYSRVTMREISGKLGFKSRMGAKTVLRRRMMRAAAILIPLVLSIGAAFIFKSHMEPTAEPRMIVEAVDNDIQRIVTLPDGTTAWLNSRTEIEYPAAFGKTRTVSVEGEAFFKVTPDAGKPFIVEAGGVSVRVLGTEFNVDARRGAATTAITLMSGSVEVICGENTVKMVPLDRVVCNRTSHEMEVARIAEGEHDWRDTKLNFDRVTLTDIFRTLETHYGVAIETVSPELYNEPITLRLSGDEPVEKVMGMLEEISGRFTYEIKENDIMIQPIQPLQPLQPLPTNLE